MARGFHIGDVFVPGRVLTAPMTGVSDLPFRRAASKAGAAYVATERVACDSFARGRPDVVRRAAVGDGLPLMVIQLVGRDPEWIAEGARLAERAARVSPALEDVPVVAAWSGRRAMTPDGLPAVGAVPGVEGLEVAAGFSSIGMVTIPAACRRLVEGGAEAFDPARFA